LTSSRFPLPCRLVGSIPQPRPNSPVEPIFPLDRARYPVRNSLQHPTARPEVPMSNFADRLAEAVRKRSCPVLVGLDPRFAQLPEPLRANIDPHDLAAVARVYQQFCEGIIDVVAPLVPAVKPQL